MMINIPTKQQIKARWEQYVWAQVKLRTRGQMALVYILRIVHVLFTELTRGQLTLRAMSLVYTTLLSLVPLIAVSFSVLKGFGVHNQVEPMLLKILEPLGTKGVELTGRIIEFVANVEVRILGFLGVGLLIYTVVSMLQKVESTFNYIWHVETSRSILRRLSDYFSVVAIGPVFVFIALGISATLMSNSVVQEALAIEPLGILYNLIARLLPYVFVIAAFTFTYMFIPNTRVQFRSAVTGGVVAGILWQTTGFLFAYFVKTSTNLAAIYSSFVILIFFMIWLYLSWLILLVGASVAFYQQNPDYLLVKRDKGNLSHAEQEKLALQIMLLVGKHFYQKATPWSASAFVKYLSSSLRNIQKILINLVQANLLIKTNDSGRDDETETVYLPAQPLENVQVKTVLDAIRNTNKLKEKANANSIEAQSASDILQKVEQATEQALSEITIKKMIFPE